MFLDLKPWRGFGLSSGCAFFLLLFLCWSCFGDWFWLFRGSGRLFDLRLLSLSLSLRVLRFSLTVLGRVILGRFVLGLDFLCMLDLAVLCILSLGILSILGFSVFNWGFLSSCVFGWSILSGVILLCRSVLRGCFLSFLGVFHNRLSCRFLCLGLLCLGYKVMETVGKKVIKLEPLLYTIPLMIGDG